MARLRREVYTTSGMSSAPRRSSPARWPSARPLSVRVTSTQPVNRFFWFHSLSPWRSRMRLCVMAPFLHDRTREHRRAHGMSLRTGPWVSLRVSPWVSPHQPSRRFSLFGTPSCIPKCTASLSSCPTHPRLQRGHRRPRTLTHTPGRHRRLPPSSRKLIAVRSSPSQRCRSSSSSRESSDSSPPTRSRRWHPQSRGASASSCSSWGRP